MFTTETATRLTSAAFSLVVSAAFFAYAIIPASPSTMV